MRNEWIALSALSLFLALAFGWRTLRHYRMTGRSGLHGISGAPGSASWWGGVSFIAAVLCAFLAPIAGLYGWARPFLAPSDALTVAGVALCGVGLAGVIWAQAIMGASWRIGVDEAERTALVTRGPFRYVRNPIFAFMLLVTAGLAVLLPSALGFAGLALLLFAVELQVRTVEEPYLRRAHGEAYARYAARAGRFVPFLGRLR